MAAGFVALPALAALEARDASAGRTAHVRSEAQFAAAAERFRWSGGTIVLLGARYDHLRVGPRGTKRLTVRATRKASTGLVTLDRTRSVRLVGLRLVPRGGPAGVRAHGVRNVRLERIALSGGLSGHEASVVLHGSTGVTITKSRFSRCGDKAVCVLTAGSSHVRILDSRFRDCYGCDFVRGNFGRRLVIRGNRFDRSLVGPCGTNPDLCNHQDLVQIHNGTGLLVERNRFGVYEPPGGGQVALFGGVSDVMIRNNLFLRGDPRVPGLVAHARSAS